MFMTMFENHSAVKFRGIRCYGASSSVANLKADSLITHTQGYIDDRKARVFFFYMERVHIQRIQTSERKKY